jgi:hypothetical protein
MCSKTPRTLCLLHALRVRIPFNSKEFTWLLIFCLLFTGAVFHVSNNRTYSSTIHALKNHANPDSAKKICQNVRILFYNVENLYDPYDDSTTMDDEFTPTGRKHWTYGKFQAKLNHLARTLISVSRWDTLGLIGFCEIENRFVLNKLIYDTPIKPYGYRIIHRDSPDARGVDVAAIYQPKKLKLISFRYFPIRFPFDTTARTRDILYVKALLFGTDTIHLFVNHWPSRMGGQDESSPRRNFVACRLRTLMDSIRDRIPGCAVIAMGDLNDEPGDESIRRRLGAAVSYPDTSCYYNLMGMKNLPWTEGTIKYHGRWSIFDQFIVSRSMLDGTSALYTAPALAGVCKLPFLVKEDASYFGDQLSRTYIGPRYNGGFSDHLPVTVEIRKR